MYVEEKLINTTARLRHLLGSRNASPVDMQGLLEVSSIDSFSSASRSLALEKYIKYFSDTQWLSRTNMTIRKGDYTTQEKEKEETVQC